MHRALATAVVVMALFLAGAPLADGEVTPPVFANVPVRVSVIWTGTAFRYEYAVTNPASNTLALKDVRLELGPAGQFAPVTPFGTPLGFCGVGKQAGFAYWGPGAAQRTPPGMTFEGIGLESPVPPGIHRMIIESHLSDYLRAVIQDREAQGQEFTEEEHDELEQRYMLGVPTLGPLGPLPGTFAHWNTWQADIAQARQLGWIADAKLSSTVEGDVAVARQAILAGDFVTARARLQGVADAIQASNSSQRTSEGYALVLFNALYLRDHLPTPCEPKVSLAPESTTYPLGTSYTATTTLLNVADGKPFVGSYVKISVVAGPHAGMTADGAVDENGRLTLTYTGARLGEDRIRAWTPEAPGSPSSQASRVGACVPFGLASDLISVKWQGGPDLEVPYFFPPLIKRTGGKPVSVSDRTRNLGDTTAPSSVTRYYLSTTGAIDPATARVIGERSVPELAPGATSAVEELTITLPSDLPEGLYHLAACADADGTVYETDERNNCSFSRYGVGLAMGVAGEHHGPAPDCSQARAEPDTLWLPNHELERIYILGVTPPFVGPGDIKVTRITQDEPTGGLGDGDISPDGFGIGTSQAEVRAERALDGNGRVYVISFHVEGALGGTCDGSVRVTVPHEKKGTPIDDGQKYDSTK